MIDDFLPFAADVGRMQQPRGGSGEQPDANHAKHGRHERHRQDQAKLARLPQRVPQQHGHQRQRQNHQIRNDQRRGRAAEIAAASDANHSVQGHREHQRQIGGQHFIQRHAPERQAKHDDRQRREDQHRQMRQRREQFSQHDRRRPQRTGQQHFVGLALFLAGDRPGGKAGGHQRGQHILAQEKQIDQILGFVGALRQIKPPLLRPGEKHQDAEHEVVADQQHHRPARAQIDEKFALQDGVFEDVHGASAPIFPIANNVVGQRTGDALRRFLDLLPSDIGVAVFGGQRDVVRLGLQIPNVANENCHPISFGEINASYRLQNAILEYRVHSLLEHD